MTVGKLEIKNHHGKLRVGAAVVTMTGAAATGNAPVTDLQQMS